MLEPAEDAPAENDPWAWIDRLPGRFSDSAVSAAEEEVAPQDRPDLGRSFK